MSPVFDVQRFSIHDGPGVRTTVFLRGCPLRCAWCQNPEGFTSCAEPADDRWVDEVLEQVLADRAFYETSGGGMTLSGGEPLLHPTRAWKLLTAAKAHGLDTCVQTCGAVPTEHLARVLGLVDHFQFDLKHLDDAAHRRWTGVGTTLIHHNARWLVARGAPVEFRMPVVPGVNDGAENIARLGAFLRELGAEGVTLLPYHRHYVTKYEALGLTPKLAALAPPSSEQLTRLRQHLSVTAGRHQEGRERELHLGE